MCGIFGYVGPKKEAAQIVLKGLKTLEYRGYDSWGIAIKNGDVIKIEKHVGKIGDAQTILEASNIGIGHTRWATHGGVTVENAHPHLDCTKKIALIHNGIIENFFEIKQELIKLGHKFLSETDTEVAAHLIEENLKTKDFKTATREAFNRFTGMNAIVVLNSASGEIIALKNGSPLVVGIGEGEYFLASDAMGILGYTKNILFLEDNNMVVLGDKLELRTLPEGKVIEPKIEKIEWQVESAELGEYKHFFIKEIFEEPKVISNIALNGVDRAKALAKMISEAKGTFLLACGSASYAATAALYLFSKVAKVHVNFAVGSEFKYIEDFVVPETLIIPISQSGESIDVIEPTTRSKKTKDAKIASIVNVLGSTLYRMSDFNFLLEAGPERAVVATKSFSAMIAAVIMTSYALAGRMEEAQKMLVKAAENIAKILKEGGIEKIKEIADKLKNKEHIYVIGRGLSYAVALEATLKIKEATYLHAEAFPGGELKHGVMALIEKGTPVIVFAPNDETYEEIISNAQEVKARGAHVIGIGPKSNDVFDEFLETGDIKEATILPQVAYAHLLGYYLSLARGNPDPDKPRNLAKSVTVK
jgi:glucosamine--fructose-6-phosphate aminotransferase (isomerizing)